MSWSAEDERRGKGLGRIAHLNPFLPERIELEREVLGPAFEEREAEWNRKAELVAAPPNVALLGGLAEEILQRSHPAAPRDRSWVEEVILFALYHRHREGFDEAIEGRSARRLGPLFDVFSVDAEHYLEANGLRWDEARRAHVFALFFQIRRAFANVFRWITGVSRPAVELRTQVWHSIFTHDLHRYRMSLFGRMEDFTTLVAGPSGTGKELVARAIGLSRYVPFDPVERSFAFDFAGSFSSLNLSALSPTLIESELFGHKRGAFTGAVGDHQGWLEACPACGTVFLDEIGELDLAIQVKLLRVLESRTFSRLGETRERRFPGKVIVATNRDLDREMREGRFRQDLYYRLCSDMIVTPSLSERIVDSADELPHLVSVLCKRLVGEEDGGLAGEVLAWIERELGRDYAWPGNVRELDQCVRNVLIRGEYHPSEGAPERSLLEETAEGMRRVELTADELLRRYCTFAWRKIGTYEGAARALGLDRRTVRSKVGGDGNGSPRA